MLTEFAISHSCIPERKKEMSVTSDLIRNHWSSMPPTLRLLFERLYEAQSGYVSKQTLATMLTTDPDSLEKTIGVFEGIVNEATGMLIRRGPCFEWWDDSYRLRGDLRPVVGELLNHHERDKTDLLEALWSMREMMHSLSERIDQIPRDETDTGFPDFDHREQELDELLQSLL